LKTAGNQSITATNAANSLAGTQSGILVVPAAAATLIVTGYPSPTTAGVTNSFTVTAKDAFSNIATGYVGTVHFTSTDASAALPANYTFTSTDAGAHIFNAALKTVGTQSITATDTVTGSVNGTQSGLVVNAAAAASLVVSGYPNPTTAGVANSFTVTARDAFSNMATGYVGTVAFTSSDASAVLPGNYTFTTADAGAHTFTAALKTSGTKTITATDTGTPSVTGTQSGILVVPAAAASLVVSGYPSPASSGSANNFSVTAKDAFANTATGYVGTVTFTTSDSNWTVPANYTFTGADAGAHTFSATLRTVGTRSLTATDTGTPSITGTQSGITVTAGSFAKLQLLVPGESAVPGTPNGKTGTPNAQTAGAAFNVTVNAVDANWNLISTNDTVRITSTDANAALPANAALAAGTQTFSVTLKTAGSPTLTASNVTHSTITPNTSPGIPVNAAGFVKLQLLVPGESASPGSPTGKTGTPSAQSAFTSFNVVVNAVDTNWNIVNSATDLIDITSSDPAATLPADANLVSGTNLVQVTLNTVGTATITASDVSNGSRTNNTSPSITVGAAQFTQATGGNAIPADLAASGAFTNLTGPVYTENAIGNVSAGTIILNAPSGFVFGTGAPLPYVRIDGAASAGKNINLAGSGSSNAMTSVSSTQLVFTVTAPSSGAACTLTWQNLRVRPIAGTPLASGSLYITGTATMAGVSANSDLGDLTEVAGAPSQFVITAQPSATAAAGVPFA